jgi:uncharacterized protein (DUF1697 family)
MPNNTQTRNENLRGVFESLGFKNVQTVIASGNVLFETRAQDTSGLEKKIEAGLVQQLDFSKPVMVRSYEDLMKLQKRKVFKGVKQENLKDILVTFFKDQKPELASVLERGSQKTTNYMANLEKEYGKDITSRTALTVERILQKMKAD